MKVSLSFFAVLLSMLGQQSVVGFLMPVPLTSSPTAVRSRAMGTRDFSNRVEARPQRMYEVFRRQASMSMPQHGELSSGGIAPQADAAESTSRLTRITRRVRRMIRKAVMGYLPEEEMSYKESTAKAAAAAAALREEAQVADPRLREDAIKAKVAAASVVERAIEEDEDDILSSDFVQLNIGDQSPMEAEDMMASLRRRLEQGLPPDTETEKAEKQRLLREQTSDRFSRPASFDGDTGVAELPPPAAGAQQRRPPQERAVRPRESPRLASSEDVARLERMFGSMGGEPLP